MNMKEGKSYRREEIHLTCHCFRYITKEDVAVASLDKVKNDGGHVRLITKEARPQDTSTKYGLFTYRA